MTKTDSKIEINELSQLDELTKLLKSCQSTLNGVSRKLSVSDEVKKQSRQRDKAQELEDARKKFTWDLDAKNCLLQHFFPLGEIDDTIPDEITGWGYDEVSYCSEQIGTEKFRNTVFNLLKNAREQLEDLLPPCVEAIKKSRSVRHRSVKLDPQTGDLFVP